MSITQIPIVPSAWLERLQRRQQSPHAAIWDLLDQVKDPEIPVVSLWDLGVLCDVRQEPHPDGQLTVVSITPTYSGCPAVDMMRDQIAAALEQAQLQPYQIKTQLAPAWTTDWLSPAARKQLQQYGIAPPQTSCAHAQGITPERGVECPACGSVDTKRISEFGSTACKALFQCETCHEPFDYFKAL